MELADAYKVLENAHEEFMLVLEDDAVMETEATYLDNPSLVLSHMDLRVSQAVENQDKVAKDTEKEAENQRKLAEKEAEQKNKCERAKAAFRTGVESFGKPSGNLTQLSEAKTISFSDMRAELSKIESSCAEILKKKEEILTLEPTADMGAFNDMFNSLVVDEVDRCKRVALQYLKDTLQLSEWGQIVVVERQDTVKQREKRSYYQSSAEKRKLPF